MYAKGGGDSMLYILVGDFRFGNEVCEYSNLDNTIFVDGYYAINQEFLTDDNDKKLLNRCISAIEFYLEKFKENNIKLLFWDMFCRQIQDRLAGKYIVNRTYCHPIFPSIDKISEKIPRIKDYIINLEVLLNNQPMHELNRLYIDGSNHPSQIGYLFLNNIINRNLNIFDSYNFAVLEVENKFIDLAKKIFLHYGQKTIIIGNSKWLYTFINYLGKDGVKKLTKYGLIVSTISKIQGRPHFTDLTKDIKIQYCNVVVISKLTNYEKNELSILFNVNTEFWNKIHHIDWDTSVEKYITSKTLVEKTIELRPNELKIQESFIEIGNEKYRIPTIEGITFILNYLATLDNLVNIKDLYKKNSFITANNSLLTKNGVAFLIEGNHAVLNFVIGKQKVSQKSLDNFFDNIINRYNFCNTLNIPYNHIIFPDKQSVLIDEFPFITEICLGEYYLKNINKQLLNDKIIYPLNLLRHRHNEHKDVFMPLDTHMSEYGSLSVIDTILKKLGLDNTLVDNLFSLPTISKKTKGDIGKFFDNVPAKEVNYININWNYYHFKSKSLFNDGLYDILMNKDAVYKKTLLLFGDSFFRIMLPHLSYFFQTIICLRTRYLHKEMVISIKPDIVLTGNVERYLSFVDTDNNAPLFMCYDNFVKEAEDIKTKNTFPDIWKSITSPHSEFAKNVFNNIYNMK